MSGSQYENIRVVLAEPSSSFRAELQQLLIARGFKSIVATGNLAGVVKAVEDDEVDLLIGDTKMPEGDLSELIHNIRHGEVGHNPFVVTITLLGHTAADLVRRVIDSGTDHVIAKPFDVDEIVDHIENLTHSRKEFVVTTDYIGPNRRKRPRPGSMEIPLITVPNPLRSRMTGQITDATIKRSIHSTLAIINEQKVVRHAYQIGWLMNQISHVCEDGLADAGNQDITAHMDRLRFVSADIVKRIRHTRYAHVTDLCMTMVNMSEEIIQNGFKADDIDMIVKLSEVIQGAFDERRGDPNAFKRNGEDESQRACEPDPDPDPEWLAIPDKNDA